MSSFIFTDHHADRLVNAHLRTSAHRPVDGVILRANDLRRINVHRQTNVRHPIDAVQEVEARVVNHPDDDQCREIVEIVHVIGGRIQEPLVLYLNNQQNCGTNIKHDCHQLINQPTIVTTSYHHW